MLHYRKAIKEHFEGIPGFKKVLDVDFIFWGFGLALYILGGILASVSGVLGGLFTGIGIWMAYFGLVLAFIKKNDKGLMITLAGLTIFSVTVFIIVVASTAKFGMTNVPVNLIIDTLAFGTLFLLSYRSSDVLKKSELKRAQEAAILAQQMQATGSTLCQHCSAPMSAEAMFCNVCGAKKADELKCLHCGNTLLPDMAFCNQCGLKLEQKINCPSCKMAVLETDVFCPGCGTKIDKQK